MSFINDEEVVVGGLLQALLKASLGVDCHNNFVNDASEFALAKLAEKACGGTHFCLKWEGGLSGVVYILEEALNQFNL